MTKLFGVFFFLLTASAFAANDLPFEPLPQKAPVPKNNPMTPAKIHLGKQLYFDPRLSKDGSVSCNSCHNVMGGGEDNRAFSAGVGAKLGGRSSPTVWNSAFLSVQFWDGRAPSLEEQAKGPMTNPVEMAMDSHDQVIERLKTIPGYVDQFKKVFGENALNIDNVVKAIAAYERTLITPNSPFDRYLRGNKKAISALAEKGMRTVMELGCVTCHNGPNFAGPLMPEGDGFYQRFPQFPDNEFVKKYKLFDDVGRAQVTKNNEEDGHFFRVPTWRNIALTAPYFHNGAVKTLDEAVRVMAKSQLDKDLTSEQVADIVAFLNTLTGEFPKQTMPQLPPTASMTLVPN